MKASKRLDDAIDNIYNVALSDKDWQHALSGLSELLGGVCVSFEIVNKRTGQPDFFRLVGDYDEVLSQQYLPYYAGISPRVKFACGPAEEEVSYDYQVISEEEIKRDEYYNDFVVPQGMRYFIAGHVLNTPGHRALFAVQRSPRSGHAQAPELELTRRLIPHIRQALNLKFRLAQGENLSAGLEHYLNTLTEAVFLLDRKGVPLFQNEYACHLLQRQDGVRCVNKSLVFLDGKASDQFQKGLAALATVSDSTRDAWHYDFVIRRGNARRAYLASLRPVRGVGDEFPLLEPVASILLVRDPEFFSALNRALLVESYSLSTQELELAVALDQGLSIQDVVKKRAVSNTTVRSQLYSLMSKMGVKRQQELLRLLSQYRQPFL